MEEKKEAMNSVIFNSQPQTTDNTYFFLCSPKADKKKHMYFLLTSALVLISFIACAVPSYTLMLK